MRAAAETARRGVMRAGVGLAGVGLAGVLVAATALAQQSQAPGAYQVVAPPACTNNKGEAVRFVERSTAGGRLAAGMAIRAGDGTPTVVRSNYAATPPAFQRFIDRHECAHHEVGDVGRPPPQRNSHEHLMIEAIADCVAILRLRDEAGVDKAGLGAVTRAMRADMTKAGFADITITSRIGNITNCHSRYGAAAEFVTGVLRQRGLLDAE